MNVLNFQKVLSLPDTYEPNTIYLVKSQSSTEYIDMYVTGQGGHSLFKLPTINDINRSVTTGLSNQFFILGTLANLNAQPMSGTNIGIAWVLDTTGDSNTNGLPAPYIYIPTTNTTGTWYSMFNVNYLKDNIPWSWIINGPQSTPSEIDEVVQWWQANNQKLTQIEDGWNSLVSQVETLSGEVSTLDSFFTEYQNCIVDVIYYWQDALGYNCNSPY